MTWSASRNKTGSPCVSATQGDFSVVLYILLSIKEHFALRRDSLSPTAVDQRTSARYAGAAVGRGPHAIRYTTIRTILVFAWYTATVFSAPNRAGSLETCGFRQRFWSLLGLRPKVTRARGHGTSPSAAGRNGTAGGITPNPPPFPLPLPRSTGEISPFVLYSESALHLL